MTPRNNVEAAATYVFGFQICVCLPMLINSCGGDTWNTTSLSETRFNLAATAVGNLALFGGGFNSATLYSVVDIYDVTSLSWTSATLSQPRQSLAAATIGNLALFAGGQTVSFEMSACVDIYNLTSNSWSAANLSQARITTGTAVGNVVLFGGGGGYRPNLPLPCGRTKANVRNIRKKTALHVLRLFFMSVSPYSTKRPTCGLKFK